MAGLAIVLTPMVYDVMAREPFRLPKALFFELAILASLVALRRMGIRTDEVKKWDNGELITARVGNREIEVELESVTAYTTRMRVTARNGGFFYDGATAAEIIVQTERRLGG